MRQILSPFNGLVINWAAHNGSPFANCGLPAPLPCVNPPLPREEACTPLPMGEVIDTVGWDIFLPEIIVGIEDPDEDIAANYIRATVIDFTRDTDILQRGYSFLAQAGVNEYYIPSFEDENINKVIGIDIQGVGCCQLNKNRLYGINFYYDRSRQLLSIDTDTQQLCGKVITIVFAVSPTELACVVDKYVYDYYRGAIEQRARFNYVRAVHYNDRALMQSTMVNNNYEFDKQRARNFATTQTTRTNTIKRRRGGMW